MGDKVVIADTQDGVMLLTLNRPEALNALNARLWQALLGALEAADADPAVRAIIITGSDKAFAAGADIAEMAGKSWPDLHKSDYLAAESARLTASANPSSPPSQAMRWAAGANWR